MNLRTTMSAVHGVRHGRDSAGSSCVTVSILVYGTLPIFSIDSLLEFCFPRMPAHPRGEIKIGG